MVKEIIFYLGFLFLINTITAVDDTKDLKLVHVIFRHGIRTPVDTYPNDPHINDTFSPVGWGQITNEGQLQLRQHGEFLRNRYGRFLGDHYNPNLFYVQTTDSHRTRMTAKCINVGLWPFDDYRNIDRIPIHWEPLDTDNLLLVRRPCAQYSLELERLMNSPEIQRKLRENTNLFHELSIYTGKTIKDFEDVQDIFGTLMAEEAFKLTIPKWAEYYYPHKMLESTIFSFVLNAYNTKLNRLKGGVFLKKIIDDWQKAAEDRLQPRGRKAFLYVGHDSTIVNLLSTLKVWDPQVPGFAIHILLELSRDKYTNEYGIEVFLRNSTVDAQPYQLRIPNCNTFCPLSRVIELTKEVIPEYWEEECKTDIAGYVPPPPKGP